MKAPRIVVVGSINMDMVTTVPRFPAPGETLLGNAFSTTAGGKGSNQAVAAAKAGGDVSFIGAIGDDGFGTQLRTMLAEAGVDTELLRTVNGSTGVAAITVSANAENNIVVVAGANDTVSELTEADLAAISRADVLLCQLEIPLTTVTAAVRHAHANGTIVVLNPSPVQDVPSGLIDSVDILVVNQSEAGQLSSITDRVPYLVTTLGAAGADLRGPDGTVHSDSPLVTPVDTTGAGDAFTGAFAVEWIRHRGRALRYACAAGGLATTIHGAAASSPTRAAVENLLEGPLDSDTG
ncbi:ribokinase [Rhodococcus sp. 27YEA15]|uniref:ribokinase n=1 Tax=Rhodococcus sp. 27YEA15 TaxID=3156259 RepID=UPI003C7EA1EB